MPGPTKAELAGEYARRLGELERAFGEYRAVTDLRLRLLEERSADRAKAEEQAQARLADQMAKNAALEQRCTALEKQGDRNWQGWLALIGAGLALLVALLKK